jgi:hypothetical protein
MARMLGVENLKSALVTGGSNIYYIVSMQCRAIAWDNALAFQLTQLGDKMVQTRHQGAENLLVTVGRANKS